MTRVLVIDDHPMFREALLWAIRITLPHASTLEAGSLEAACDVIRSRRNIDLVLFDLLLPGVTGFDGLILLRNRFPSLPVLVVSGLDNPRIVAEAIRLGASGFVPKRASKQALGRAILDVLNGELSVPSDLQCAVSCPPALMETSADMSGVDIVARLRELTPCQIRVVQLIRRGLFNKQIAHELGVGETTVKGHITEILRKLGVDRRTQIVIATMPLDFEAVSNKST